MNIEERIKEILIAKAYQYEIDIKTGKKKPLIPDEDYIDEDGIRVRKYTNKK